MLSADDRASMAAYEKRGLVVHMTEPVPPFSFIPWAMPFLSQMIGKAIGLCADTPPDIILGWYFEPYGVAAHLIGRLTGSPVVLQHAGSDLGRLMNYSDLRALYSHMLSQAACVITGAKPDVIERLTEAGADPDRLCRIRGSALDPEFNAAEKLDLEPLVEEAESWFSDYGMPDDVLNTLKEWNRAGLSCGDPAIGTYGKVAEVKGIYALIDALDRLAGEGVPVAYHALWSASPKRFAHAFQYLSAKKALKGRSIILPPLPPWRVPAFTKSCAAVAFLENRFPIAFHGPQIPREVLACGRPLIVSGEIYDRQYLRTSWSMASMSCASKTRKIRLCCVRLSEKWFWIRNCATACRITAARSCGFSKPACRSGRRSSGFLNGWCKGRR